MSKIEAMAPTAVRSPSPADAVELTVASDPSALEADWRALQADAVTTAYQTFQWAASWQKHVGAHSGVQPLIVMGRGRDGVPLFILPFGLITRHGCRVLTWLSAPHCSYGFGVFSRRFLRDPETDFSGIWRRVLDLLPKLDAIDLRNQPVDHLGHANPFACLNRSPSADRSHILNLAGSYDDLFKATHKSRTRRRLRQHERELSGMGSWRRVRAGEPDDIGRALDGMFAQKRDQLADNGIETPFDPAFQKFLHALSHRSDARIRCLYLELDGEIVATNISAVHGDVCYGLITSMASGGLRRLSPGTLAMNFSIETALEDGLSAFDFSPGEADYKARWADRAVDLFDTREALSVKGAAYCALQGGLMAARRRIKHSPRLYAAGYRIRAAAYRLRRGVRPLYGTSRADG